MGDVYQTFKEELIPILLTLFQIENGTLCNSFCEVSIIDKTKDNPRKDNHRPMLFMNTDIEINKNHKPNCAA